MSLEVLVLSFEVLDPVGKLHGLGLCAGPSLNYHRLTHFASSPLSRGASIKPPCKWCTWHL